MIAKLDMVLLALCLAVVAFGTVMVASASVAQGDGFWYKHLASSGLGVAVFVVAGPQVGYGLPTAPIQPYPGSV